VFSVVLNTGLTLWMNTKTLNTFRFAGVLHSLKYRINDLLHIHYFLAEKNFDSLIDEFDLELIVHTINSEWDYRSDLRFWDVANPPVQSFLEKAGDCDDHARLMAYILHKKYPAEFVYFVMMTAKEIGHATAIYYDPDEKIVGIIDVSGLWVKMRVTNFDAKEHVSMILKYIFDDTIHIDVRTWDTRKSIVTKTIIETAKESLDANYIW